MPRADVRRRGRRRRRCGRSARPSATAGVEAIREFSARFDGVAPDRHRGARRRRCADALDALDPAVRAGLEESIRRLRATCEAELEHDVVTDARRPARTVTQRMVPVDRVGLYVPGGLAPLVSSVRDERRPGPGRRRRARSRWPRSPQKEHGGLPHPTILAACALLGVDEVYAVGGAQAIAMFAYGAGPCAPVDLVTGPGNIYTVAAKRLLKGVVGIDSEAGPTEIAILADDTADPAYVAADLISQAEHDPLAAACWSPDSSALADDVEAELDKQVLATRHTERIRTALAGQQSGIVLVDDLEQGLAVVDAYAAEHLEIQTADAAARGRAGSATPARSSSARSPRCRSATTAPAPTTCCPPAAAPATPPGCRCGRSSRRCTSSTTTREALAEVADHVVTLAEAEDLPGHGAAVRVRFGSR